MIAQFPKTTRRPGNELVAAITDHIRTTGRVPDILQIETWANFRQPGGLGRVLTALQDAASKLAKRQELVERVCQAVEAKYAFNDGDETSVVATIDEFRAAVREALS